MTVAFSGTFLRRIRATRRRGKMVLSSVLSIALVASGLALSSQLAASADSTGPALTVTKTGPSSATPGATLTYVVTVTNPSSTNVYNVSLVDILPSNVSYVSGSTKVESPYSFGNPEQTAVTTTAADSSTVPTGETRLLWSNQLDLAAAQSVKFKYQVLIDDSYDYASNPTITNVLSAYADTDPRTIPDVDSNGVADDATYNSVGTGQAVTTISDISIVKDKDPATGLATSGSVWLRGVHENVYTVPITVSNSGGAKTVKVVDYLPAAMEFLGTADNSSSHEWTDGTDGTAQSGAITNVGDSLSATDGNGNAVSVPSGYQPLQAVETIELSGADAAALGLAAGVYTKVTWLIPVAAQGRTTIKYHAAIPLCLNTTTWSGEEPSADSLEQSTNLDNNSCTESNGQGGYTRDLVGSQVTNYAAVTAVGDASGDNLTTLASPPSDTQKYTIVDVVQGKSITSYQDESGVTDFDSSTDTFQTIPSGSEAKFRAGQVAWFTLTTQLSEYVSGSNVVVTDTLPDGMQPALPADASTSDPSGLVTAAVSSSPHHSDDDTLWQAIAADPTATVSGTDTPVSYRAVSYNSSTGGYSVSFTLATSDAENHVERAGSVSIAFPVFMKTVYNSTGEAVRTGDKLVNTVEVTVDSYAGVAEETTADEPRALTAGASETLRAPYPSLTKQVLPRDETYSLGLTGTVPSGLSWEDSASSDTAFSEGDLIWFKLDYTLGDKNTRFLDETLTDFLPTGTTLYGWRYGIEHNLGSDADWTATVTNGACSGTVAAGTALTCGVEGGSIVWRPNSEVATTATTQHLVVYVAARITDSLDTVTSNLAKATTSSTAGLVTSYRDSSAFAVTATPTVSVDKTVTAVNGSAPTFTSGNAVVKSDDTVRYKVTVTNNWTSAIVNPTLWDVLPAGFGGGTVYNSDGTTATSGVTTDTTTTPGSTTLKWQYVGTIASGSSVDFYVSATVVSNATVNTTYTNTVAVRDFQTTLNWDNPDSATDTATWYPDDNIDSTVTATNTDAAQDTATVVTPNVTVTKDVTTGLTETNNSATTQAVVGEKVTYTVAVTVPAGTRVVNAKLVDQLNSTSNPTIVFNSAPTVSAVSVTGTGASTSDVSFESASTSAFTVHLGTYDSGTNTWTLSNTSATAWVYTFTLVGHVTDDGLPTSVASKTVKNTATFTSTTSGTIAPYKNVAIVQPNPTLVKQVRANASSSWATSLSGATSGQEVEYRLTATNPAGGYNRPALKAPVFVDTLPVGVTYVDSSASVTVGGTPLSSGSYTVSYDSVTHKLTVSLPSSVLAGGATILITYKATLPTTPSAGSAFTNTATVSGTSLTSDQVPTQNDSNVVKTYTATNTALVTVSSPSIVKTVKVDGSDTFASSANAVIGQGATWKIVVTLPANLTFHDVTVTDVIPAGFHVDESNITLDNGVVGNTATPSISSGTLTLNLGDIESSPTDRTVTITVPGYVLASGLSATSTSVSNSAVLVWDVTDDDASTGKSANSSATIAVKHPSVTIDKQVGVYNSASSTCSTTTANTYTPQPGENFCYTLTVSNSSGYTAYAVKITDTQPSGVVFQSASTDNSGALTSGTASWTIPSIASGSHATLTIVATLASSSALSGSSITNTGTAAQWNSYGENPFTYNSTNKFPNGGTTAPSDTANVTPLFPAVTVSKRLADGQSSTVLKGDHVQYQLTVTNATGAGTAYKVSAIDTLPTGWTYTSTVSVTVGGSATTSYDAPTSGASGTITWAGSAGSTWTLAPGASVVITYTATPGLGVTTGLSVDHINTLTASAQDATGVDGHGTGNATKYATGSSTASAHIAQADIGVAKEAVGNWVAGTAGTANSGPRWKITIHNYGPDSAQGPFVLAESPTPHDGVSLGALYTSGGATVGTDGSGNYSYGSSATSLASGGDLVFYIPVTIGSDATGTVENSVTVSATTDEGPNTHSNTDDATADLTPVADLGIAKSVTSATFAAGQSATWTVVVTNYGPSVSHASAGTPITVTDDLSSLAGTVDLSTVVVGNETGGATASYDSSTKTVTVTQPHSLALNGTFQFTITATIKASTTGTVSNTATVTPGETTNQGDNTHDDSDTVTKSVDSTTTLKAGKDFAKGTSLVPGAASWYLLTVTNTGTADATDVTLTEGHKNDSDVLVDGLPDGLTYAGSFESVDGANWATTATEGDSNITFTLADPLAPDASASVLVKVNVDDNVVAHSASVTNWVTADASNADPDSASQPGTATANADLAISKVVDTSTSQLDGDDNAIAGKKVTYTLTVTNNGPSTVPASTVNPIVVLDDLATSGFAYVSSDVSGSGFTRDTSSDTQLRFERTSPLKPGSSHAVTFSITVRVPTDAAGATGLITDVPNTATVSGPNDNPEKLTDNTSTAYIDVVDQASLSIIKAFVPADSDTDADGNAIAGGTATYTLRVTNAGPSTARQVSVADAVPAGFTITSITGSSGWSLASGSTNTLVYSGLLAVDSEQTITVVGTIDASYATGLGHRDTRALTNTATVQWSDSTSTEPKSDSDSDTVDVVAEADLSLSKTAVSVSTDEKITTATAGTQIAYSLRLKNLGLSQSDGPFTITDVLPAGVTFVSAVSDGNAWVLASTTPNGDGTTTLVWTRSTAALAPGQSAERLLVTVLLSDDLVSESAATAPQLTNSAVVDGGVTYDPVPSNNSDSATVDVVGNADLSVTKTHQGDAVIGQDLAFAISVHNAGPSVAHAVTVTDTLPAGLSFVSIDGSDPAWSVSDTTKNADGTTTITLALTGSLAVGVDAPALTVVTTTSVSAYPSVTNAVSVTSDITDPNPSNNTDTDPVTVSPSSSWKVTKKAVGTVQIGKNATYVITFTNVGLTEDPAPVTITDNLPAGLTYVSGSGDNATCSADANQTVTCVYNKTVQVGEVHQVTLTLAVNNKAPARLVNIATVDSPSTTLPGDATEEVVVHAASSELENSSASNSLFLAFAGMLLALSGVCFAMIGRLRRRTA